MVEDEKYIDTIKTYCSAWNDNKIRESSQILSDDIILDDVLSQTHIGKEEVLTYIENPKYRYPIVFSQKYELIPSYDDWMGKRFKTQLRVQLLVCWTYVEAEFIFNATGLISKIILTLDLSSTAKCTFWSNHLF